MCSHATQVIDFQIGPRHPNVSTDIDIETGKEDDRKVSFLKCR